MFLNILNFSNGNLSILSEKRAKYGNAIAKIVIRKKKIAYCEFRMSA